MTDVPDEVRALAAERDERRRAKDFAAADALRDRIDSFSVIDGPDGPSLEPVEIDEPHRLRPRDVESLLDDVPTADMSVHWVVEGWPEDVVRALAGFRANEGAATSSTSSRTSPNTEPSVLRGGGRGPRARDRDGMGRGTERRAQAFAWSDRPGDGRIGRTTGDVFGPLEAALEDPSVGVCGPFGISTEDLREFHDDGPRSTRSRLPDGVPSGRDPRRGAVRREVPLVPDGRHRVLVPDQGRRTAGAPGRRAGQARARMYHATPPAERDRLSKRNYYRFLERFRDRFDLLVERRKTPS